MRLVDPSSNVATIRPAPLVPQCVRMPASPVPASVRALIRGDGGRLQRMAEALLVRHAWHASPAASVPDDNRELGVIANCRGYFKRVRGPVLAEWMLCNDARFYHPEIARIALHLWITETQKLYRQWVAGKSPGTQLALFLIDERPTKSYEIVDDSSIQLPPEIRQRFVDLSTVANALYRIEPTAPRLCSRWMRELGVRFDLLARARTQLIQPSPVGSVSLPASPVVSPSVPDSMPPAGSLNSGTTGSPRRAASPNATSENETTGTEQPQPDSPEPYRAPECPHRALLDLWREVLPELPQPFDWHRARRERLMQRWREHAAAEQWPDAGAGLARFRHFFEFIRRSPYLMGRQRPHDGRPAFVAELQWLLDAENWSRLHEGAFHRDGS